ncbi:MAG: NfeD family protein [Planctomycetaceae bacterium]|jgi:membrane protein implicated in regulation of membrane protease activity|nr:NfeD family protein [Planctomycetaceae bacterium]
MDIHAFLVSPWFWLSIMVIFAIIELLNSFNLITIWFVISALVMVFVSLLTSYFSYTIDFRVQLGMFLIMATVMLFLTRPIAIKKFRVGQEKTNVDGLIEQEALVVKRISKFEKGEIKVNGQIWTAIPENSIEIEAGQKCIIVEISGVKAIVKPI